MGKKNITISVDEKIAREARIMAAERETSVSKLLAEKLKELVDARRQSVAARKDFLRLTKKSHQLNYGQRAFNRDSLHER
jgi:hypothetical protein